MSFHHCHVMTMVILVSQFCLVCPWAAQAGARQRCEGEGGTCLIPASEGPTRWASQRCAAHGGFASPPVCTGGKVLGQPIVRKGKDQPFLQMAQGERTTTRQTLLKQLRNHPVFLHSNAPNLVGDGASQPTPGNRFCLTYFIVVKHT